MVFSQRFGPTWLTMRMVVVRRTRLIAAAPGDAECRQHGLLPVVLTVAVTVLGQQLALGGPTAPLLRAQPAPASAETGVRDALQRYSAALESLDPQAVKKVQPSIAVENLAKAFKDMRELKVDIDEVRVLSLEAATARVSCRVKQTLTPKAGSKQTTAVTRVMRLRRDADSWLIDSFER